MNARNKPSSSLAGCLREAVGSNSPSIRVGVSGHRALEELVRRWVGEEVSGLLSELRRTSDRRGSRVVSSLAIGADQLFAQAALDLSIPNDVVLPFSRFADDFEQGTERDAYERLLASAASLTLLPWADRSNGAYLAGGLWVVDHCDVLIAVWDGEKAAGVGGTGDVVDYCRDAGKPCIHMHTENLEVEVLQ